MSVTNENTLLILKDWIFQLADDKLVIGHRDSEWLGLCPDIEGDVAFSSIAQDEVGHAVFFYELLHKLGEGDPDSLAYGRGVFSRRNAILLEKPNKNWIFSIVRHFFYDVFDHIRLHAMIGSICAPLHDGVQKILSEEKYHLLHMRSWFERLGDGDTHVRVQMEQAISCIWEDLPNLFHCGRYEQQLVKEGIIQYGSKEMQSRWVEKIKPIFNNAGLSWREIPSSSILNGRIGEHSSHLRELLGTMTEVYELDHVARW